MIRLLPDHFLYRLPKAMLPVALLFTSSLWAQTPDTALVSKAKRQYAGYNSVVLNEKERLEIKFEEGELTAQTFTSYDRLLLSEMSPTTQKIDYTYKSYFNRLTDIDAVAYLPNGKGGFTARRDFDYFSTGAGNESVFYDDLRFVFVSFPALKRHSVVRMTTAHDITDVNMLPRFFPMSYCPVMSYTFEVTAPEYVHLKFAKKGLHTEWITEKQEVKQGKVIYTFTCNNLPAFKEFDGVPSSLYYQPHIIPYITSFRVPGEQKDSLLLSDVDHLYRIEYKHIANLNIKKDTMLEHLVAKVTAGDKTQREKAKHIYEWVQKNMHYIAFEAGLAGFVPREADTVCKRKFGDCKDMSSILVTMCRIAGMDAHFTWVGTNYLPYRYDETPMFGVSNHMICAVNIDNQWVFLDGTHPNLPFGASASVLQGKQAMIAIDAKTYKVVTIPENPAESNLLADSTHLKISAKDDRNILGTVAQHFTGYTAWDYGAEIQKLKDDEKEKVVKLLAARGNDKYLQEDYSIDASEAGDKPLHLTSKFRIDNYVQKSAKSYIINMNLKRSLEDELIDTAGRAVPWYFHFKNKTTETVMLDIPKGYKVAYLPKEAHGYENGLWGYDISYKAVGDKVILTKNYRVETLAVKPESFLAHNRLVDALHNEYKESVVLTTK